MDKAPVSVIMAVRNGADYIGEALQSVLDQTRVPDEIIVIDDGSIDQTPSEVRRFPEALYVRRPPLGFFHALNYGLSRASNPYIAFLDADDLWTPKKTEVQLDVFSNGDHLDFVSGHVVQFTGPSSQASSEGPAPVPGRIFGALTIRLDSFGRVGPLSTAWRVGGNVDWWARADEVGLRGQTIPDVALLRRIHDQNLGRVAYKPMHDYLGVLRSIVNRRREKQ